MKYYAVRRGRTIGIFDNWPDCDKSVRGFRRAEYKSFKHSSEAKRWFDCAPDNQTTLDLWYPIDFTE
jgi:ribonuclease HI